MSFRYLCHNQSASRGMLSETTKLPYLITPMIGSRRLGQIKCRSMAFSSICEISLFTLHLPQQSRSISRARSSQRTHQPLRHGTSHPPNRGIRFLKRKSIRPGSIHHIIYISTPKSLQNAHLVSTPKFLSFHELIISGNKGILSRNDKS